MKLRGPRFHPRLLAGCLLLAVLLAGCAQSPESCPPYSPVDLSGVEAFAGDDRLPFRFPLDDFRISPAPFSTGFAAYGTAKTGTEYHAAEDVLRPAGTPVYAMAGGTVRFSGPMGGYGWLIIIDHPQANLYSLYGHLSPSRWRMRSGTVEKGALIAYLGDSDENGGSAKHPLRTHLHFGVRAGQRADYPGLGEWRWQAGWIKPCPQDLGWLQPSTIVTGQEFPVGGFPGPAGGFLAIWGLELLFAAIYLFGGACMLVFALRRNKPMVLVLAAVLLLAAGWILHSKGARTSTAIFAMAVLLAGGGVYSIIRRSVKLRRTQP